MNKAAQLLAASCLLLLLTTNLRAEEKLPMDTVILIDSSGSMKQTDPEQLRIPAAKLFISLLDKHDRLSIVSFSDQAWPITFLTQLDSEEHIDKALQATDKVSHKGIHTNIMYKPRIQIDFCLTFFCISLLIFF